VNDDIRQELVRRWIPCMQLAKEMGIPWEEVEAIMWAIMKARSGGDGNCYVPAPAKYSHLHLMCCLITELLEIGGLPTTISLVDRSSRDPDLRAAMGVGI